ncbi:MAG: pyridoxamine 5'-phosphate oxidase family protein [Geovibrio sp.]|nr:pyridoxamine 5'-phosphate oxidase family protein [Geovibrio sp.]
MRRSEREIKDYKLLENLLKQGEVIHLALADAPYPYLVTVNYGYEDDALYFHCASEGRKIDLLRKNPKVFFQLILKNELVKAETACRWTTKFTSVCGEAEAVIQESHAEKRKALRIIMSHYGMPDAEFTENMTRTVLTVKLNLVSLSGKSNAE